MAAIVSLTEDKVQGSSTSLAQTVPVARWKTWTAMMLAFGATPEELSACPAAIPATWVPCWHILAA
jgi:hypothetical protein